MVWRIEYAESVQKDVRKLDAQERKRIRDFIEVKVALLDDPRSLGKPLSGGLSGLWRYRVGNYRIIANVDDYVLQDRLVIYDLAVLGWSRY